MNVQSISTKSNLLIGNHLLRELEAEKKENIRLRQKINFLISELDSDSYIGRAK